MIILRAVLTIPFAILALWVTAVVSDLIIVEVLNSGNSIQLRSLQQTVISGSVLPGLIIGWFAAPAIFFKSKMANKIKVKVLSRFQNLESRSSRLEFVLVCLFCAHYIFITFAILHDYPLSKIPKILFYIEFPKTLIIWGPLIGLLIYRIIKWVWVGRK